MTGEGPGDTAAWKKVVARYQQPSRWRAVWQIVNSLVPYAILWYLIHRSLECLIGLRCRWRSWRGDFWCGCSSFTTIVATVRFSSPGKPMIFGGSSHSSSEPANSQLQSGAEPLFQSVPPVTLFSSFKSFTFRLWDEKRHRLVGFSHLGNLR